MVKQDALFRLAQVFVLSILVSLSILPFSSVTHAQDSLNVSCLGTMFESWGDVQSIAVFGDTVLLGIEHYGHAWLDISDPASPVETAHYSNGFPVEFEQVNENLIYSKRVIYRVQEDHQVIALDTLEIPAGTGSNPSFLEKSIRYPYIMICGEWESPPPPDWPFACITVTVGIYDISNPDTIRQVYEGEAFVGDYITPFVDFAIHDSTLYLSGGQDYIDNLYGDFTDVEFNSFAQQLIVDDIFYAITVPWFHHPATLEIYTFSEENDDLELQSSFTLSDDDYKMKYRNGLLELTYNRNMLRIYDITNPVSPQMYGLFDEIGELHKVWYADRDFVHAAGESYDIYSRQNNWFELLSTSGVAPGGPRDICMFNNYGYMANSEQGIFILDLSAPGLPDVIDTLETETVFSEVMIGNNYLLALSNEAGNDMVVLYNLDNMQTPVACDTFTAPVIGNMVTTGDSTIVVFCGPVYGNESMCILDTENDQFQERLVIPEGANRCCGTDRFLFAPFRNEITVFDLTRPADSTIIATLSLDNYTIRFCEYYNGFLYAYAYQYDDGYICSLMIIDARIASQPEIVDEILLENQSAISIHWGYLFIYCSGQDEFMIYDLADRAHPALTGYYPDYVDVFNSIVYEGQRFYCTSNTGLRVFDISEACPTSVDEQVSDQSLLPQQVNLSAPYPNPFNSSTRITLNLSRLGNGQVEIVNILGQRVQTLISGEIAAGHHELNWNSNQACNGLLSSGIYFVVADIDGQTSIQRLILMK